MNPLISVIVPIYNVGSYLEDCIVSLLNQSYKNIEILAVDDGSTDNSLEILNGFSYDKRLIILHKQNGGVSSARNYALDRAKGEFIAFVDGDDFVAEDYIETLVELQIGSNADFCILTDCYENKHQKQAKNIKVKNLGNSDALCILLSSKVVVGSLNKLFRKSLIDKLNLRYDTKLFYGEGLDFITTYAQHSKIVTISNKRCYFYRKNNSGSATTKFNLNKYNNGGISLEKIEKNMIIRNKNTLTFLNIHKCMFYLYASLDILENKAKKEHRNEYKLFRSYFLKTQFKAFATTKTSLYQKGIIIVGLLFPRLLAAMNKIRKERIYKNSVSK